MDGWVGGVGWGELGGGVQKKEKRKENGLISDRLSESCRRM